MANPLKALGDLNNLRKQAQQMQQQLQAEEIRIEEGDILVVISGDQKIKQFSVQGVSSPEAIDILNKAIKKSQELAAKNFYRPTLDTVLKKYKTTFKDVKLFTVEEISGGWKKAQEKHFSDKGLFDQIYSNR